MWLCSQAKWGAGAEARWHAGTFLAKGAQLVRERAAGVGTLSRTGHTPFAREGPGMASFLKHFFKKNKFIFRVLLC